MIVCISSYYTISTYEYSSPPHLLPYTTQIISPLNMSCVSRVGIRVIRVSMADFVGVEISFTIPLMVNTYEWYKYFIEGERAEDF